MSDGLASVVDVAEQLLAHATIISQFDGHPPIPSGEPQSQRDQGRP